MSALIWSLTEPDLPLVIFTLAVLTVVVIVRKIRRA